MRGEGALPELFILFFFPCSADHERDWPPCKVVFFGLAANTLNTGNNNNNNNNNNSIYQFESSHNYSDTLQPKPILKKQTLRLKVYLLFFCFSGLEINTLKVGNNNKPY